jgi:hypothetical protein
MGASNREHAVSIVLDGELSMIALDQGRGMGRR